MERLTPHQITDQLTEEQVDVLAQMANEIPQTAAWKSIFEILSDDNYRRVMDKRQELQRVIEARHWAALSSEDQAALKKREEVALRRLAENKDPLLFLGNMGTAVTVEDYKNRFGIYPPNYNPEES